MPTSGYVAMALGVVFSVALGCGLMALVFYSSRHGYDDASRDASTLPHDDDRHTEAPAAALNRRRHLSSLPANSGSLKTSGASQGELS